MTSWFGIILTRLA